ncbi:MAG: flagellin [Pseudomonadota bacterium]
MTSPISNNVIPLPLNRALSDIRERLEVASEEAVTGRKSNLVADLNGQVDRALLSQKAVTDIATQRDQLNLRGTRLELAQQSVAVIQEVSSGFDTRLSTALGVDDVPSIEFAALDASVAIDQIFSSLNIRHGERYLFAGDASDTPPFPDASVLLDDIRTIAATALDTADFSAQLDLYFDDPAGPFQQTIYSGAPTASDPDAVLGTDPAIVELLKGLSVLALAGPDEVLPIIQDDPDVLQSAAESLFSGQTAIVTLQADRGIIQEQIEKTQESLDIEETILSQAFNDITARDQFEAAAQIEELQANLEAALLLTSRIANLSLINFLR